MQPLKPSTKYIQRNTLARASVEHAARRLGKKGIRATHTAIAGELGVSQPMVSQVASGKRGLSAEAIRKYACRISGTTTASDGPLESCTWSYINWPPRRLV